MAANPKDFAYFHRGESPPYNSGTGATTGFDYFRRGEPYPAAIPASVTVHSAAAVLSGTGAISAAATRTTFAATVLAGSGALAAAATRTAFAAATLPGVADLSGAATRTAVVAVTCTGIGGLSATGTHTPLVAPASPRPESQLVGIHHEFKPVRRQQVQVHWATAWQVERSTVTAKGNTEWHPGRFVAALGESLWRLPHVPLWVHDAGWYPRVYVAASSDVDYHAHDPEEHEVHLYLMAMAE